MFLLKKLKKVKKVLPNKMRFSIKIFKVYNMV